ncbi:MAG: DNA topoisomerase I [Sphingobacteriales bacterium 17-39-43]|uniref:type I DNA topoisomerase n=1 Tax=Daejeonella sp. TaxID=2805397 RepID=UPI000BD0C2E3|nr:type I DNA topoisomerase [Daejeonella sp.]OYY02917.1 MAG: DNA topoisomerase I [Sphingobacteriia bacterium 35-40-5]OYZ33149.1 MAG: DNA topoisomerase I [Sphingobacteriales bacterium 16-39-50]OZA26558.1 MAG: DNA topoisomerase I [Sphingobacteriales bacterium 17-39-43]HQT21713.1 type I DNA topoisomerase [Daejeonella sp.]HQT56444.1 type I DNA topoisomerase [Daejeonella sp.]
MAKNLLIVESPAKAKTIEGYLGKDFLVKSSYGHIRDLIKTDDAINVNNNFEQRYEVPSDKKAVVNELKKLAKDAEMVWLASDEDREGEAISWHLFETLGLKEDKTKRIVFHEITKTAILKAIETPRKIDYNLVYAQQARRVLDRLVGFELSPVLWKKVKPSLSAGRVQSVAVRLIVDREREVNKFTATAAFRVVAVFSTDNQKEIFRAELPERFEKAPEAENFLKNCINAIYTVNSLETRPTKRSPAPPFTTSTLQQEASRKLGFSVARTMSVAQKLYESGKITYMRTDSVNLSDTALNAAADEIRSAYGEKYHQLRKFKTKSAGAQEAHEAIRPTYFEQHRISGDSSEQRLYELIWKRSIASQMAEANFEKTTAKINISTRPEEFVANGEVMKFDGFLKVYFESKDEEEVEINLDDENENSILPPLSKGQRLNLREMNATERYSRPPARYTEASLVKKLEELGIGRPSTYAPTISTIQNRGYVVKEEREGKKRDFQVISLKDGKISSATKSENTGAEKNKLFPTDIGAVVNDFLVEHFKGIVDFNFTAKVEKEFDEIAQGLKNWTEMLRSFYNPFHTEVENTLQTANRASGERELGNDPESGKKISVRIGRYGPFVQIGESQENEEDEKPRYASLRAGQMIETITLAEALDLFKLPFQLEDYQGKELSVGVGRFGPYIKWGESFISLPKGEDPLSVNLDRAIELIDQKNIAEAPIAQYENLPVTKGKGRFGPFIKWNNLYINVPVRYNFDQLGQAEINELISNKVEKESNRFIQTWPSEKIALENGRWGPFIRFGKQMLKLGKNKSTNDKYSPEELASLSLEAVKKLIEEQVPDAFAAKTKKVVKKVAVKKSTKKLVKK